MNKNSLAAAKMCRLCETKDGPFLNIFGPDMDIAKKIENVVFITINEYDDLPHKICFRCSARLEDFQEFLNKCIQTQENLSKQIGKRFSQKNPQTRKIKYTWEAKLNENKISNEQYCDELIKKALELATDFTTKVREDDKKWIKKYSMRDSEVRLQHVDKPGFPGIEKRNGKYNVVDIRKIPQVLAPMKKKCNSEKPKTNPEIYNPSPGDLGKLTSSTKIVLKNVSSPQIAAAQSISKQEYANVKKQGNAQSKSIPDNFTTVRVSGVGPVYTCKNCDSVILELQRVYNHKCVNLKNSKAVILHKEPNQVNQPTKTVENQTQTQQSNTREYKAGPARHKRRLEVPYTAVDQDHIVDLDKEPDTPPPLPSNNIVKLQGSANADNSNKFFGYQFPSNFYLVPSGNNTFALKTGPHIEHMNQNQPSPSPSKILYQVKPSTSILKPTPVLSQMYQTPQENMSILPDINRTIVNKLPGQNIIKDKPKKSKKHKETAASPPPTTLPPTKVVQTKVVIQKKGKSVEAAKPAPYPIGLLCRNTTAGNGDDFKVKSNSSSSKSPQYPHYTILPPKTPGKIVISTIPQKNKTPSTDGPETRPPKKRRKHTVESEDEESSTAPEQNQHFFTYINLDNMLGPPSVLSTETVQESSVSTTVTPMHSRNESQKKIAKIIKVDPKQNEEKKLDVYTCSICDLTFSREKKLIAHVRTHYETYDDD